VVWFEQVCGNEHLHTARPQQPIGRSHLHTCQHPRCIASESGTIQISQFEVLLHRRARVLSPSFAVLNQRHLLKRCANWAGTRFCRKDLLHSFSGKKRVKYHLCSPGIVLTSDSRQTALWLARRIQTTQSGWQLMLWCYSPS
jgi:hypothetical protein